MCSVRTITAPEAADLIVDGAVVTVSSSSGMGCPDAVLAAIGERFQRAGHPQNITSIHPIAAGDMYGVKGIDHLAQPGLLAKVIAGSYPSGPSSMTPPLIWQMINDNAIPHGICLPGSYLICTGKRRLIVWRADTNRHGYLCGSPVAGRCNE